MVDLTEFVVAASTFGETPGAPSDDAVDEFLRRYPLSFIFRALEHSSEVPGLESAACAALERIFNSPLGASMLPSAMPYAAAGLKAPSTVVRQLACSQIKNLLEHAEQDGGAVLQAITQAGLIEALIEAISDSDTGVAHAVIELLKILAKNPSGLNLLLGNRGHGYNVAGKLKEMAMCGPGTVRVRVMALAAAISSASSEAAEVVQQMGLLDLMVKEVDSGNDVLTQLNALELLAELASTTNGADFIAAGNICGRLAAIISAEDMDPLVRTSALAVAGRLLPSTDSRPSSVSRSQTQLVVRAIDTFFERLNNRKASGERIDECEESAALDALGQIGLSEHGAEVLLMRPSPAARHVFQAAWRPYTGGRQLAAVHALASIMGAERSGLSGPLLSKAAEDCLSDLVYSSVAEAPGSPTPGDAVWLALQQSPEMRIAVYRLVTVMIARPWGLSEFCLNDKLVDYVTDPRTETTKTGMEWRHSCVVAGATAASAAVRKGVASVSSVCMEKLNHAARQGPYLSKGAIEPRPIVITDERPAPGA